MENCQFAEIECTNEKCREKVLRYALEDHAKHCPYGLIRCPHCEQDILLKDEEAHQGECMKLLVECPNHCQEGFTILREELSDHLTHCQKRMLACTVSGCETKVLKAELEDHMASSVQSHITNISDNVTGLQRSVARCQSSIVEQTNEIWQCLKSCQVETETVSQRLTECEDKLSEAVAQQKVMQQKTLEACYQSVDNLQKEIQAVVSRMEQYMKMSTDKAIKMEEMVSLQAVQIQRLEERQAKNQGSISSSESVREMFTAQDRVLATHDIKLAEHSLRLDMMDCKNTDGVLLWKITEVRRRRREAVSGKTPSIYSQPFYTSQCGYKMCARMYLNGDGMGRGTHLSLFFVVMRGEYDSLLPWPFSHKVTLILIDQVGQRHISDTFRPDPQSSSFVRPKNEMNVASGCPLFVSLMTLDSGGYVKDDAMFIKMVIDTTNVHKPDMR
jgi:TNF receptor-associated factor 3